MRALVLFLVGFALFSPINGEEKAAVQNETICQNLGQFACGSAGAAGRGEVAQPVQLQKSSARAAGHANEIAQQLIDHRSPGAMPDAAVQGANSGGKRPANIPASDFRPEIRLSPGEAPPIPLGQGREPASRFESVRQFAQNTSQLASGALDAWRNNFTLGLSPRVESPDKWFNTGHQVGDVISMAQGVLEFAAGAGGELGSVAAEAVAIPSSGGLALALVPAASAAASVSASVATHGSLMAAHASKEFNSGSQTKPAEKSIEKPIERNISGEKIADHYFHPGKIMSQTTGINGAHSKELFEKALEGQGKIIKSRPIAGFDGMELIEYQLYNSDITVAKTLREGKPYRKTVIDPAKWPKERVRQLAETLFKGLPDGYHRPKLNGVQFEGRVTNGEVEWFGVIR